MPKEILAWQLARAQRFHPVPSPESREWTTLIPTQARCSADTPITFRIYSPFPSHCNSEQIPQPQLAYIISDVLIVFRGQQNGADIVKATETYTIDNHPYAVYSGPERHRASAPPSDCHAHTQHPSIAEAPSDQLPSCCGNCTSSLAPPR